MNKKDITVENVTQAVKNMVEQGDIRMDALTNTALKETTMRAIASCVGYLTVQGEQNGEECPISWQEAVINAGVAIACSFMRAADSIQTVTDKLEGIDFVLNEVKE